jgi:hypothetical protein
LNYQSLASEFEVKAAESDAKSLEQTERESTVHVEVLLSYSSELHVDLVVVILID